MLESCSGKWSSHRKECGSNTHYSVGECRRHYDQWEKLDTKGYILYDSRAGNVQEKQIHTGRLLARGWAKREMRGDCWWVRGFFWGRWKHSRIQEWWLGHNSVQILKITERVKFIGHELYLNKVVVWGKIKLNLVVVFFFFLFIQARRKKLYYQILL